jgi:YD repeat-containing protein
VDNTPGGLPGVPALNTESLHHLVAIGRRWCAALTAIVGIIGMCLPLHGCFPARSLATQPAATVSPITPVNPVCPGGNCGICPEGSCGNFPVFTVPELGPAAINGEDGQLGYDINAATGNLFLAQPDIHLHPALGPDLRFVRYYNSQGIGPPSGLGPNWSHTFSWNISFSPATVASVQTDTGRFIVFGLNVQSSVWQAPPGEFGSLSGSQGAGAVYTTKYGTAYTFDSMGRLTSIKPADNTAMIITYSSGTQINNVTSGVKPGQAERLLFSYADGLISTVTQQTIKYVQVLHTNRFKEEITTGAKWQYGYGPAQFVSTVGSALAQSPGQALQTVMPPSNLPQDTAPPMTLYTYSPQTFAGKIFSPGTAPSQLTGYAVVTSGSATPLAHFGGVSWIPSDIHEAILGLFSYSNASGGPAATVVSEAAGGVVANQLLRDVQLAYNVQAGGTSIITTATLNGGTKTLLSQLPAGPGYPRLVSIIWAGGSTAPSEKRTESWTWNSDLTLAQHTDGNRNVTQFGIYLHGNPIVITEAVGTPQQRITQIQWHPILSRPLSIITESSSQPNCFNQNKLPCNTDQVTLDYSAPGNGPPPTFPNVNPTNYLYQVTETGYTSSDFSPTLNSLVRHSVQIQRDGLHRVTRLSGPLDGQLTTFAYSPSTGYVNSVSRYVTSSFALTTSYAFNNDGLVSSIKDANGNLRKTEYDLEGNIILKMVQSADSTLSSEKSFTRDLAEDAVLITTPDGTLSLERDSARRIWRVSGSGANGVSWSRVTDYDPFDHPVTVRTFAGAGPDEGFGCTSSGSEQRCTEFSYNAYEQLYTTRTLDPSNNVCPATLCTNYYFYDPNGNLVRGPGDLNTFVTYQIDPLNRVNAIINKNGGKQTFKYDTNDHAIDKDDERDSKNGGGGGSARDVFYVYDDFGNFISVTAPDLANGSANPPQSGTWINQYDASGNLVGSRDSVGSVLTYVYDGLNRRTAVISSGTPFSFVGFGYENVNMIAGLSNTQGRLTEIDTLDSHNSLMSSYFGYDYRGRLSTDIESRSVGATQNDSGTALPLKYSLTTAYGWSPKGHQLDTITYPDGLVVSRQYSGDYGPKPRVSEVDIQWGVPRLPIISGVKYFASGALESFVSGNASGTTISQNTRGEVTSLTISPGPPLSGSIWQENLSYNENWSDLGRISNILFQSGQASAWSWSLAHDPVGHLTSWTTSNWSGQPTPNTSYEWTYDEVGNIGWETDTSVFASCATSYPPYPGQPCNPVSQGQRLPLNETGTNHVPPNGNQLSVAYNQYGFMYMGDGEGDFYVTGNQATVQTNLSNDSNGNVQSVAYSAFGTGIGAAGIAVNSNGDAAPTAGHSFIYNSHHRLREVDLGLNGVTSPVQFYSYDGRDHVAEIDCVSPLSLTNSFGGALGAFPNGPLPLGITTAGVGYAACNAPQPPMFQPPNWNVAHSGYNPYPNEWGHNHFYFYDSRGRVLEELDFDPTAQAQPQPCPTYQIIDHIYLAGSDVARVVRSGNPASQCATIAPIANADIQYLHHDHGNALVAVQSKTLENRIVWEASVSPTGQTLYVGVPGASGQLGNSDSQPPAVYVAPGPGVPNGQLALPLGASSGTPDVGRSMTPVGILAGGDSPYLSSTFIMGTIGGTNPPGAGSTGGRDAGDSAGGQTDEDPEREALKDLIIKLGGEVAHKIEMLWDIASIVYYEALKYNPSGVGSGTGFVPYGTGWGTGGGVTGIDPNTQRHTSMPDVDLSYLGKYNGSSLPPQILFPGDDVFPGPTIGATISADPYSNITPVTYVVPSGSTASTQNQTAGSGTTGTPDSNAPPAGGCDSCGDDDDDDDDD